MPSCKQTKTNKKLWQFWIVSRGYLNSWIHRYPTDKRRKWKAWGLTKGKEGKKENILQFVRNMLPLSILLYNFAYYLYWLCTIIPVVSCSLLLACFSVCKLVYFKPNLKKSKSWLLTPPHQHQPKLDNMNSPPQKLSHTWEHHQPGWG